MNKKEYFADELKQIKDEKIREFGEVLLEQAPDYFFEVAASSTGKYHPRYALGQGGLIRHTKALLKFMNYIFGLELSDEIFTDTEKDLLRIAGMYHDAEKHGKGNSNFTTFTHPLDAAKTIRDVGSDYLSLADVEYIAQAIESHMGQWNTSKRDSTVLPKPTTDAQKILHICDYLASRKDIIIDFPIENKEVAEITVDTYILPFGKNKGKTLAQINESSPDYIEWMKTQSWQEPISTLLMQL